MLFLSSEIIELSFNMIDYYDLDPMTVCGPQFLIDFLKISAFLHGMSLSEYSDTLRLLTRGIPYETANTYTYRTPRYQLSGAQDHQKGMSGWQEHIWQATLDEHAYVFTNSPGTITKEWVEFVGGWRPRATLYKNVGVIQYDREVMPFEGELVVFLINLFMGNKFYQHAYFPRWAFDEVRQSGGWVFGVKNDSYVALYSYQPTWWENNYELRVWGYKNAWIVELGSIDEYASFDQFVTTIQQAQLTVVPQAMGYSVCYDSPSQGLVTVAWDGPMNVNGTNIDLGPYPRFDNDYCYQEFGTKSLVIQFETETLELDFENVTRTYSIV